MKKFIFAFCLLFAVAHAASAQVVSGKGEVLGGSTVVNHLSGGVWPRNGGYSLPGSQLWAYFTFECHNLPEPLKNQPITIWIEGGSTGDRIREVTQDLNNAPIFSLNENSSDGYHIFAFYFQWRDAYVPDLSDNSGQKLTGGFVYTGPNGYENKKIKDDKRKKLLCDN